MNITDFAYFKFFYNFLSLYFSVGSVLRIAGVSKKKKKKYEVYMRSKARSFDGNIVNLRWIEKESRVE